MAGAQDEAKRRAAQAALSEVRGGMVLGLGTGSTAERFVEALAARVREEGLEVTGVPTSVRTERLAASLGLRLVSLDEAGPIDLAVDGCDELDPRLDLIKGLGGALVREKAVDYAARRFVVVADRSKRVRVLGAGEVPLPIEVEPAAAREVGRALEGMGASWEARTAGGAPFVSDNGNPILDARFGPIVEPAALELALDRIPGVVGNGLFTGRVSAAYLGTQSGVELLVPPPRLGRRAPR